MIVIKNFKDRNAELIYSGGSVSKWQNLHAQIERRLQILDRASCLDDLRALPSNRFEALKGDRKNQYSIRVNIQWRLCFVWKDGEPHDVEIVDYH